MKINEVIKTKSYVTLDDIDIPSGSSGKFLKDHCSTAYNSPFKIYRGMPKNSYSGLLFGNSSKITRKSANTGNYYTELMDNFLPAWNDYPSRSKSFICSTANFTAAEYGDLYQVYPIGDPIIGICPQRDIWDSFKNINLADFSAMFQWIQDICNIPKKDSWADIESTIIAADVCWENEDNDFEEEKNVMMRAIHNNVDAVSNVTLEKFGSFTEFLTWLLDPKRNKFQVKKLSQLPSMNNNEVWFSGAAYFKGVRT